MGIIAADTDDVAEVPSNTDTDGSAEIPAETSTGEQVPDVDNDFQSAFQRARKAAGGETETGDEEGEGDDEAESDDKIPDDKDGDAEDKPEAEGDAEAEAETKKTARSRAFKEIEAENQTLKEQNEATVARLNTLEQELEKYGGVDAVETALSVFDKIASGKAVEIIDELPPHERAKVVDNVFTQALSDPSKRVEGVNAVLKSDFGLTRDLPQPLMEKIFEFATGRLNYDADDFEAYLDRELEFMDTPETKLQKVEKELERLKNPDAKAADDAVPTDFELTMKANEIYNQFEAETYAAQVTPLLASYGLDVKPTDSAAVKSAKEALVKALDDHVGVEIRKSKAFEPLLPFWLAGEKDYQTNVYYKQGVKAYERAMKAKIEPVLKSLSTLFGSSTAAPKPEGKDVKGGGSATPKLPAPDGKSSIQVPEKSKKAGGGFSAAFAQAKKAAGNI